MNGASAGSNEHFELLYARVCDSYQAVDDFRMKLLGLLPIATGSGVFVLLSTKTDAIGASDEHLAVSLGAVGLFGLTFTVGLFSYEMFGVMKCHYLIETGRTLERDLRARGQFRARPSALLTHVNEPFASALIYPACMAAWSFLGLVTVNSRSAAVVAGVVFLAGFVATLAGAWWIRRAYDHERRILDLLAVETLTAQGLRERTGEDVSWVDGAIHRLQARGEILAPKAPDQTSMKPAVLEHHDESRSAI